MKRGLMGMSRRQIIEAARGEFSRKGGVVEGVVKVRGDANYYRTLGAKAAAVRRARIIDRVRGLAELACYPEGAIVSVPAEVLKEAGDKAVAKWLAVQAKRTARYRRAQKGYEAAISGADPKARDKLIAGLAKS